MKSKKKNPKKSKKESKKKIDPVVHFEIPYNEGDRMADFYSKAFGWQTKMLGEEMGQYILATTSSKVDKRGRPKKRGVINGGFFPKKSDTPAQHPSLVVAVADVKKSMKKIADAGGKVLGEPMEIPGYGLYVTFIDTEGNQMSIMQPFMAEE